MRQSSNTEQLLVAVFLETAKEREMSSQKNVPDARIELGTTFTRPALYHLIFVWQGLSFLKIFSLALVSKENVSIDVTTPLKIILFLPVKHWRNRGVGVESN